MAILEARFDIVLAIDLVSSVFIILTLKKNSLRKTRLNMNLRAFCPDNLNQHYSAHLN